MRKGLTLFLFLMIAKVHLAQVKITPTVLASTGNSGQAGDIHLEYTIGETFVTTLENGGMILTQGFHQPLEIEEGEEVLNYHVYNAFSPNADLTNDTWIIDGIQNYEQNTVKIFNRWGDIINNFENYDNVNVVWDGTNKNGTYVTAGTYFYIIEAEGLSDNGWVQVAR